MTRRSPLLAALAAALVLLSATAAYALFDPSVVPSGRVATESRDARGFSGVAVSIPGKVVVRQGESPSVTIEADDNLLPEIETVVEDGALRIRFKRKLNVSGRATIRLLSRAVVESMGRLPLPLGSDPEPPLGTWRSRSSAKRWQRRSAVA